MARIPISSFFQGINSSQPESRRNSGYQENIYNASLETLKGSTKRQGLILDNIYTGYIDSDSLCINLKGCRIFISQSIVLAFNEHGDQIEIDDHTGTDFSYIKATRDNLDYVTTLDTAFIVNRDTEVSSVDGISYTVKTEVEVYSDLPKSTNVPEEPVEGAYYRVVNPENFNPAGYYKYSGGTYTRVSAPNDKEVNFDKTTMPHRFIYDSTAGKVIYDTVQWTDRLSGDYLTNNIFPIVGKKIKSINYFQERLVLLTEENLNLSRNSDVFNFFVNDTNNVVVQDRISRDILFSNVGKPLRTVVVNNSLLILCENALLCFDAELGTVALTNANGSIRKISDLKCQDIIPGYNGNSALIADNNNYIILVQVIDPRYGPQQVMDLNNYEPKLLQNKTIKQIYLDRHELYVLCSDGSLFIHRDEQQGNQYVQLAWSRFTSNCHTPLFIDSWGLHVRMTCLTNNNNIAFDWYDYDTNIYGKDPYNISYDPRLDARESVYGSYDPKTDETVFEHSIDDASQYTTLVNPFDGSFHKPKRITGRKAYFNGKFEYAYYLGFVYEYRTDLTNLWLGSNNIRLIGSRMSIFVQDSTDLDVITINKDGKEHKKAWTNFSSNISKIDKNTPKSTAFDIMLVGDTRYKRISFRSSSPGPLTVNAINYKVQK